MLRKVRVGTPDRSFPLKVKDAVLDLTLISTNVRAKEDRPTGGSVYPGSTPVQNLSEGLQRIGQNQAGLVSAVPSGCLFLNKNDCLPWMAMCRLVARLEGLYKWVCF